MRAIRDHFWNEWVWSRRMDTERIVEEYAAADAIAEEIISEKHQVDLLAPSCTGVDLFTYIDSWFGWEKKQWTRGSTPAEETTSKP